MHARPALRAFVRDNHHVARGNTPAEDALTCFFLRAEHARRAAEFPDALVDAGSLDDASVLRDVAIKHGEAAVLAVSMGKVADTTGSTVSVERRPPRGVLPHLVTEVPTGRAIIDAVSFGVEFGPHDAVPVDVLTQRSPVDTAHGTVKQVALGKLAEDAEHAAGAVALLNGVLLRVGGQLAQARHVAAQAVDVGQREIDASLLCHGEQMKHRIGGSAHRYVERHGIQERRARRYTPRKHALISFFVIPHRIFHNQFRCVTEKLRTVHMSGQDSTVAG